MYIQYFWQGNHHTYSHIRCVYTVLTNLNNETLRQHEWMQMQMQMKRLHLQADT